MSVLDDGLADVSVPEPVVLDGLRNALRAQETAMALQGGGRDFRAEDRQAAADKWLTELEAAVLRR